MNGRSRVQLRRPFRAPRWLRPVGVTLAAVAVLLVFAPGVAGAAPAVGPAATGAYTLRIDGFEYAFTSTEGRFAGYASGARPGAFVAVVDHTPLSPAATITPGGSVAIAGVPQVKGTFTGGSITPTSSLTGCRDVTYAVTGTLTLATGGSGAFRVTLTHGQALLLGKCVTYAATVSGTVTLTPGGGTG